MKICRICGKPLSLFDSVTGITEHEVCLASEEDRAREMARLDEQARAKAEEEERRQVLLAQRQADGLNRIIGQQGTVQRLRKFAGLYANGWPGHVLLTGPDGVGKRTLARAFAREYCPKELEIDAKDIGGSGDLMGIFCNLGNGHGLIITNLQRLRRPVGEPLISGLKDFAVDFVAETSADSKTITIPLLRFTCIATASSRENCQPELVEAFPLILSLSGYSHEDLVEICQRLAGQNKISLTAAAAELIARASDGTPHQVELLVKKLAGLGKSAMEEDDVAEALSAFGLSLEAVPPNGGLANLEALSGVDFERLITSLLHHMGFEAVMTKASGDGGVDIVAMLDQPLVGGRYLVQCKRFAVGNLVGAATVREFYGAVTADARAVKGILITTSDFTNQAKEFARRLPIELIGGARLNKLLSEHGLPTGAAPTFRLFS